MTDEDRRRWDARHAASGAAGADDVGPPRLFERWTHRFPTSGRALELACGRGGSALWLARRGLEVWGLDISPVAVGQARELARRSGMDRRCTFDVVDLDGGLPEGPPVDLVLCHLFRDARLDGALVERLAPGGVLAVAAQSEVGAGPGAFRVRPGELVEAFADLDVVAHGEGGGEAWLLARV